jgi:hypothetical protein
MDEKVPSAGDHEWREVMIHIFPQGEGAHFVVRLRKRKGMKVLWDRRLSGFDVIPCEPADAQTLAGILQLVADVAFKASERARH